MHFGKLVLGLVIGAVGVVSAAPVLAQSAEAGRCLYADNAFSPGARFKIGAQVFECTAGGAWTPTSETNSSCFHNDAIFTEGAVVTVPEGNGLLLRCLTTGVWEPFGAPQARRP